MQSYTEISDQTSLENSRLEILNNDKTVLSCSSGTAFPTLNLQVGMLCHRSDEGKLYQLTALTPTWKMIFDLNKTATDQEYVDTGLGTKQATITGAASTITSSNLTTLRVVTTDGSGKITVSTITTTKLGYLTDVTSNIQAQIDGKLGSTATAADSTKWAGAGKTVSTGAPTGGSDGDIWLEREA